MSFENKVVFITGGSSGIGYAAAQIFTKEGAYVAIVGRNKDKLTKAGEELTKIGNKPLLLNADIGIDEEAKTLVQETVDKFGKLDILVNNAGIANFGTLLSEDIMEQYDKITAINLRAAIHITSLAAPYLIKTKGSIVNVSSALGKSFMGVPNGLAYGVSKAGLDHFSKGIALELYPFGVRVNTVSPGPTRTNILINSGIDRTWEQTQELFDVDKISEPGEVADLIVYLASDKAKSITGSYFLIDNGCLARKS